MYQILWFIENVFGIRIILWSYDHSCLLIFGCQAQISSRGKHIGETLAEEVSNNAGKELQSSGMQHHVIWYTSVIFWISWVLYYCTWPHILYRNLYQHRCNNNVYRTTEYFTTHFRTSYFTSHIVLGLANELFRMWHLCVALFHKISCTLQRVFVTHVTSSVACI